MNGKNRNRPPKPDWKKFSRTGNVTRIKRKALLAFYNKEYEKGRSSEEIVVKLSQECHRDVRTIYRYLAEARQDIELVPSPDEHREDLIKLAKELERGLLLSTADNLNAREGIYDKVEWDYNGKEVRFSAETRYLYKYLLQHLDAEDKNPNKFSDAINIFKKMAYDLKMSQNKSFETRSIADDMFTSRRSPEAIDLRNKLRIIIERNSLKGICDICKNWR